MTERKIIAYSLLAQINNQSQSESSYESVFLPLIKRGLSKMCNNGIYKGDDIADIKKYIDELYDLNMPNTILKKLLQRIEKEINTDEKVTIKFYADGSFYITEYLFDEFEEEICRKNEGLVRLNKIFDEFLKAEGKQPGSESIFDFVEQNKVSLGKYINKKYPVEYKEDNTTEARFINFIKPISELYSTLQSVYIGSIISSYLEYQPTGIKKDVELVLDTNFIISLIDLNTSSSTANCRRLLELASKLGYRFTVLNITIREIDQLLKTRVDYFDSVFLTKQLDPEDIYNACERRGLTKTDLDNIRFNIVSEITGYNIQIIENTDKYENKAKFSTEFEKLKEKRNTSFAALHDATCIEYVKEKRGKPIHDFDKVNCWFLNNSSSRSNFNISGNQPYIIKAEDLLNLLWLTSPMVKSGISASDLSTIGLSRLVSSTLDDSLPNAITIKQLDDNIQKYAKGTVSDEDIVRVSKGIAARTISNLDALNDLAKTDNKKFIETLQEVADVQKKKEDDLQNLLNKLINDITVKSKILDEKTINIDVEKEKANLAIQVEKDKFSEVVNVNSSLLEQNEKIRQENLKLQNDIRKPLREKYIRNKVLLWRLKSLGLVLLGPIILFLFFWCLYNYNNKDFNATLDFISEKKENMIVSILASLATLIYSGIFIKIFADRYNQSAVNAFKSNIDLPENLKPLN